MQDSDAAPIPSDTSLQEKTSFFSSVSSPKDSSAPQIEVTPTNDAPVLKPTIPSEPKPMSQVVKPVKVVEVTNFSYFVILIY